jgi:hypothetical protein
MSTPASSDPRFSNWANLQAARSVPPLIARTLTNEDYYRDGPPTWPGAPTSNDVKKARRSYIKRLRRFARQFPEAKKLAKILARCKRRRRCMSGACPQCTGAFQRWFVAQVVDLASKADPGELKSISIIFQKHQTADEQLNALGTTGMKRSLSQTVKDADGLEWMAGGIDLSLNDDRQKKQGIAWQPQFYGLADVNDVEALSNLLRGTYSPTKPAPRPVQIKECDGSTKVISYAFKTDFVRRIAYRTEVGPSDNRRKCWHTRKVSLRAGEHVQAMLWMHRVGLAGRLFLRGVRMTRTGNSVGLVQIKKLE